MNEEDYYARYKNKCAVCGSWFPPRNKWKPTYMCMKCRQQYLDGPFDFEFQHGSFTLRLHYKALSVKEGKKIFATIRRMLKEDAKQ